MVANQSSGSAGFTPSVAPDQSFDALYGLELTDAEQAGVVRARVRVSAQLLTEHGRLHGGVPAAISESLASHGTALVAFGQGSTISGLSNDTTVTASVREGATLHAVARALSRADDYWLWAIEQRDDDGTLCAFSRVTIAVRPLRSPTPTG